MFASSSSQQSLTLFKKFQRFGSWADQLDLKKRPSDSGDSDPSSGWREGWTHLGAEGQTRARHNNLTGELQVRDGGQWIVCAPDCIIFFTPKSEVRA